MPLGHVTLRGPAGRTHKVSLTRSDKGPKTFGATARASGPASAKQWLTFPRRAKIPQKTDHRACFEALSGKCFFVTSHLRHACPRPRHSLRSIARSAMALPNVLHNLLDPPRPTRIARIRTEVGPNRPRAGELWAERGAVQAQAAATLATDLVGVGGGLRWQVGRAQAKMWLTVGLLRSTESQMPLTPSDPKAKIGAALVSVALVWTREGRLTQAPTEVGLRVRRKLGEASTGPSRSSPEDVPKRAPTFGGIGLAWTQVRPAARELLWASTRSDG